MPTRKAQKPGVKGRPQLPPEQRDALLKTLKARFEKSMHRHRGLRWPAVQAKLEANPEKLWSLHDMERTGGEPDVVGDDKTTGEYVFYDCSAESPKGRRAVCYDRAALEARKEHKPKNSAMDMAAAMRIEILTEAQYRELQTLGEFDTKTSSWGSRRLPRSEHSAVRFSAIAATTMSSRITTVRSRTTPHEDSAAR